MEAFEAGARDYAQRGLCVRLRRDGRRYGL